MERRISPRSKTRVSLVIQREGVLYTVRCVELSQTGLLASVPKTLRDSDWPYATGKLMFEGGAARVLLRRVGQRGRLMAYSLFAIDEVSQERLTDHLFDVMHAALPKRRRRRAA